MTKSDNLEPCLLPDRVLFRLNVGPQGAMVVRFSNSGHVLAVACQAPSLPVNTIELNTFTALSGVTYNIRLYDAVTGKEVCTLSSVHQGVIYDLQFSKDDSFLLSCSTDSTAKVWDISNLLIQQTCFLSVFQNINNPNIVDEVPNPIESTYITSAYCYATLQHVPPCFVYSAIFQEFGTVGVSKLKGAQSKFAVSTYYSIDHGRLVRNNPPRVITGSADGTLRVWDCATSAQLGYITSDDNNFSKDPNYIPYAAHDHRVQALVIDERSRYLFSGDSDGDINVWRIDPKDPKAWFQLLRKFVPILQRKAANRETSSKVL